MTPERKKVLITVLTYPLPSRSYDELVCTAGMLEDGSWIRIYPTPLSFLMGLRENGILKSFKYNWIELDLVKRTDDFRPESHSPVNYNFKDLKILNHLDTKSNWAKRKEYCLVNVYTNLTKLIEDSKEPTNTSLATFNPKQIIGFEVEKEENRDWKDEWKELRKQGDLFAPNKNPEVLIPKVPYKFYYKFKDEDDRESRLMIEDWEIGQLFWNCLKSCMGNEEDAIEKVKQKYFDDFTSGKDLYLFLGTTKQWHTRRATNPFVIIGVFYPKNEIQISLFE
jgi:hypothetical protein